MKKILVAVVIIAILLTGCSSSLEVAIKNSKSQDSEMFECVYEDSINSIYRHKDTGVCYYVVNGYKAIGVTPMLNADGKPYVMEGEQ